MKRGVIPGLIALILTTASVADAQDSTPPQAKKDAVQPTRSEITTLPIVVDLADQGSQIIKVDAGTYQLTLMNTVPGRSYWLHIGPSFSLEITVLSAESLKLATVESRDLPINPKCGLRAAVNALIASPTEMDVRTNVESLRIQSVAADPTECAEDLKRATEVLARTSVELPNAPIIMTGDAVRRLSISSRDGGHWDI